MTDMNAVTIKGKNIGIVILVFSFVLLFSSACENREKYAGLYQARLADSQQGRETAIELKENGQGVWRIADDEASFSWTVSGNEVRLHTKAGGVIIGAIKKEEMEIILPGSQKMSFVRKK